MTRFHVTHPTIFIKVQHVRLLGNCLNLKFICNSCSHFKNEVLFFLLFIFYIYNYILNILFFLTDQWK